MPQVLFRPIHTRGKRPDWKAIAKEVEDTLDRETKPMLIEYHERIVAPWSGDKPGPVSYTHLTLPTTPYV